MAMPGKIKVTGTATSIPVGLAWSAGVSLGVTGVAAWVAAWLVLSRRIAWDGIGYCSMVILLLGSVCGAVTAVRKIKRLRLQMCMASGAVYYGCLLAITALFFGGQYQGMGVTGLLILGGCGAVALLTAGQGRGHPVKNHRKW